MNNYHLAYEENSLTVKKRRFCRIRSPNWQKCYARDREISSGRRQITNDLLYL